MMPGNVLSSVALPSAFLSPRDQSKSDPLVDLALGGVALNDGTQGLQVKTWTAQVDVDDNILVSAPGVAPTIVVNVPGITWVGLTFDTNMRIFLTWLTASGAFYRWFDTDVNDFLVSQLPAGSDRPFCQLDDARSLQTSTADIILAYVRAGTLYYRQQRDRYGVERSLAVVGAQVFHQLGMNHTNRLQFQF